MEHKLDFLHIFGLSGLIADEAQILIQKMHDVLRLQATELLVFIISNKDRLQHSESPNSMPIAYALKGRCLSNHELRFLINKLRDTLLERKIKVLCEIYNGEWQYTVMHNEDGNPLNRLRVSSGIWSRISKLSKSRIFDELMTVTTLNLGDMDLLRFSKFREGRNTYNNVKVTKTYAGALHISTLGGNIMNRPCAKYIVTPLEKELWKQESSQSVTCTKTERKAMAKSYGLKPTEWNLLAALPTHIVGPFLDIEGNHGEDPDDDEEYLPDLMPVQSGLHQLLTSESFNLLQDIAVELKEYAPDK